MKRSQADLVSILRHIGEFSCHEIFKDEQSLLFRKVPYAGKKKSSGGEAYKNSNSLVLS